MALFSFWLVCMKIHCSVFYTEDIGYEVNFQKDHNRQNIILCILIYQNPYLYQIETNYIVIKLVFHGMHIENIENPGCFVCFVSILL